MKTCPNPNCKFTGIPDEAKFCPNCGAALQKEDSVNRMTISECRIVPSIIKKGEQCRLIWKGDNVSLIFVDDKPYQIQEDIILAPNKSHIYNIAFVDSRGYVNGKVIREQLNVTVKSHYLFDGKGIIITSDGHEYCIVDIRQCSRKSGIGMDADYVLPGIRAGVTYFYAVLEENQKLHFLVIDGKLEAIFLRGINGHVLKIWKGMREEKCGKVEDVGLFSGGPKVQVVPQIYYAFFNNRSDILIQETSSARADTFGLLYGYDRTYKNEITSFLGMSLSQLLENAVEYKG